MTAQGLLHLEGSRAVPFEGTLCEHLIVASGVKASDRVLVFGYNVLGHLVDLARAGVDAAMGVHAGYPYRPHEPVDVVWFTCVSDVDAEVNRLLGGIGRPRVVAVELLAHADFGLLRRLLRRLRDKGLDQSSYYKVPGRFVLTVRRSSPAKSARIGSACSVIPMYEPSKSIGPNRR